MVEKLDVWNNSMNLVQSIYNLIENFPKSELYCLTSQIE